MHVAWLLVLFVPVYKQLGLFFFYKLKIIKRLLIMLSIISQRILNRLIIDISISPN